MPEGAIYVGRGSRWGNPWREGDERAWTVLRGGVINREAHGPLTAEQAIESYRNSIEWDLSEDPHLIDSLRCKDLACWCSLDQPCHSDVLLELANRSEVVEP